MLILHIFVKNKEIMSISKTVDIVVTNIKKLREIKGWNKSDLARACNVDQSYISRIEKADRHIGLESIEKIAEAFKVQVYELFIPIDTKDYQMERRLEALKTLHPMKREMIVTMLDAFIREQEM